MTININNNNMACAVIKFKEMYNDALFDSCRMIFKQNNLSVAFTVQNVSNSNGLYLAEMYFETSHPYFSHPFIDAATGTGKNEEDAVRNAVENFGVTVINSFLSALNPDTPKIYMTAVLGEKENRFYTSSGQATLFSGARVSGARDLFSVISDSLPNYLGNQKAYSINLFVSCSQDNIISEVTINNMISKDLSDLLEEYAKTWSSLKEYHSEKMHILLIQDESTYIPSKYSCEFIEEQTDFAIEALRSAEDIQSALRSILSLCSDLTLTFELTFFIPEILCQKVFRLNEKDLLIFKTPADTLTAAKSQIANYEYISRAVQKFISENIRNKELIIKILKFSSKFSALNQAVSNGSKIEDLVFGQQLFNVPESFELR